MRVLVVNAGSSSLKLRVLDDEDAVVAQADVAPEEPAALAEALVALGAVDAVGHRVVHGGADFVAPVVLDEAVVAAIRALTPLAPLHQPLSLGAIAAVGAALVGVPAVACFDTAFHATLTPAARAYALPEDWRERWDLRRFGFHGLSHAYVARRAAALVGRPPEGLGVVSCHLGAGASITAIRDGVSVDTTMGFTPLEGVVMATRSGSVDPGLLLWLLERGELSPAEMKEGLERRSGLAGLAGTPDMREVLLHAAEDDERAVLALQVYLRRLRAAIASMTAAIGGLDVLAFTGGVGARSAPVRAGAADGLAFLGVAVDPDANQRADGDADVSAADAAVRTLVIADREDAEIARGVRAALG